MEPKVSCCKYSEAFIEAIFSLTDEQYEEPRAFFIFSPYWYVRGTKCKSGEWGKYGMVNDKIEYCPCCGKKLPELELIPDVDETRFPLIAPGGEWCDRCDNSPRDCSCEHSINAWRIKEKEKIEIPKDTALNQCNVCGEFGAKGDKVSGLFLCSEHTAEDYQKRIRGLTNEDE